MNFLINLSIIQSGGGLQVALSFINELKEFPEHQYCILLSPNIHANIEEKDFPNNFSFYIVYPSPSNLIKGGKSKRKIKIIEKKFQPDVVFTLFGPSYWKPKALHVCGFALAQHLYKESPYFSIAPLKEKMVLKMKEIVKLRSFKKHCDYWITETVDVADRLSLRLNIQRKNIFTVNNVCNGIFDHPEKWITSNKIAKENKAGFKLVTISSFHIHKNLLIIPSVIDYLRTAHPDFNFVFILTVEADNFPALTVYQKEHLSFLGKVSIEECPPLYQQSDALFMPTLLECFTVSYLEAMKMQKPILTSDLPFAHTICQEAALYFDPMKPEDIGEKIFMMAKNKQLQQEFSQKGTVRLKDFGTAKDRAKAYLDILENIVLQTHS